MNERLFKMKCGYEHCEACNCFWIEESKINRRSRDPDAEICRCMYSHWLIFKKNGETGCAGGTSGKLPTEHDMLTAISLAREPWLRKYLAKRLEEKSYRHFLLNDGDIKNCVHHLIHDEEILKETYRWNLRKHLEIEKEE